MNFLKETIVGFLGVFVAAVTMTSQLVMAQEVPSITDVQCEVRYRLRDQSTTRGVLEDTACLLRVGFSDFYAHTGTSFRNIGGELVFGCKLQKGESTCSFSESELQALNQTIIQSNTNPRLHAGINIADRSSLDRKHGCVQFSSGRLSNSPYVTAEPAVNTRGEIGSKCLTSEDCSLDILYVYDCLSLPEEEPEPEDPNEFRQCRDNYQSCVSENLRLQVQLSQCNGGLALIVPITDFSGELSDCQRHLDACKLSTFQLNDAVSQCAAE